MKDNVYIKLLLVIKRFLFIFFNSNFTETFSWMENRSWEVPQHGNVYYKDVSRVSLCEKASDARGAEEKPGESSLSGMLEKEKERINTLPRSMPRDSHILM